MTENFPSDILNMYRNRYSTRQKYGNRKVTTPEGLTFDSVKEFNRWNELILMEKAGVITELQRQVKYVLIPIQREKTNVLVTKGKNKGLPKEGKVLEKECAYVADFVYSKDGHTVVEDTKGFRTADYIIKRKLMLYIHGIQINEI